MPKTSDTDPGDSGSARRARADLAGRLLLGRFQVERALGHGGMGEVLLARDTLLHRPVALKRLSADGEDRETRRRALLKEARRASQINDRHIAAIYDVLDLDDDLLLVMEYVEGETLRERLSRPVAMDEFWSIATQCAGAMAVAHAQGVVHRDLKPENLMLSRSGEIKVLDFGIARRSGLLPATSTTTQSEAPSNAGTPQYMAPEVHLAGVADERSDIFSLGVVFYEILTGSSPFAGPTYAAILYQVANHVPPPASQSNPAAGSSLAALVGRMMAKDPANRPASFSEVVTALGLVRDGGAIPRAPVPRARIALQPAALLLLVAFIAVAGILIWRSFNPGLPRDVNLAVLAPQVRAGAPEFSLGIMDVVQARLRRHTTLPGFQMAPFSQVLEDKVETARDARQVLGATVALVSVVQPAEDRLHARLTLVETEKGRDIATRIVDVPMSDPFTFYDRLYREAAGMLRLDADARDSRSQLGIRGSGTLRFYLEGLGILRRATAAVEVSAAVSDFENACRTEPGAAPPRSALSSAELRMFRVTGDSAWIAKAETAAREGVTLDDTRAESHLALGEIFQARRRLDDALAEFQRAAALDTMNEDYLLRVARTYARLKDPEREMEIYRLAVARRPHVFQTHWWLANALYRAGRVDEATVAYREMIQRSPLLHEGYSALGALQVLRGEYAAAIDTLKRSVALRPTQSAYDNLGTAYFNTGRGSAAIDAYNQSFQFGDPGYQSWLNLGDAYYWLGPRSGASEAYLQGIRLGREEMASRAKAGRPAIPMIPASLSTVFPKLGYPDSARIYLALALAADSANPLVRFSTALTRWQLGDRELAIADLRKSVEGGYPKAWLEDSPVFQDWRQVEGFQQILGKHDPASSQAASRN